MSETEDVLIALPPVALEQIATRAAQLVLQQLGPEPGSPWLTRKRAAAYLGISESKLAHDPTIPVHRADRRVLYRRDELDEHFSAR